MLFGKNYKKNYLSDVKNVVQCITEKKKSHDHLYFLGGKIYIIV